MVWAMREPGSFGDYFPDGEFIGWDEQLESYYNNEMSDEEKSAMGMQDRILFSACANKLVRDLGPLKPHECPAHFQTVKTYTNLASLILMGAPVVDESLKSIIETLEPGVHQFWPITITMPKGRTYPKQYYGMRIAQFLDGFSPEQSDEGVFGVEEFMGETDYSVVMPDKKHLAGLALDVEKIGSAHLWREKKHLHGVDYFFSNALHDAIVDAGLRVPTFYQLKVVYGVEAPSSRSQTTAHSNAQKPAAKSLISKLFSRNR